MRRRSGGGAVLVVPEDTVWIDVILPVSDPLWDADVVRSSWWLGEVWAAALGDLGLQHGVVHRGRLRASQWSSMCCFAGLGPAEVVVGGRKVVGIAQRRTRYGALFQCAVPLALRAGELCALLALGDGARTEAQAYLESVAGGLGALLPGITSQEVEEAFFSHLALV